MNVSKPVIVVDRGPWYRWVLERFGNRNRIERWFRELKNRTKRFYNNVNSKNFEVPRRVGNCNCNGA
jgi:putative transposase